MRFRRYLLGIIAVGALVAAGVFFYYGQAAVFLFGAAHNLDIEYRSMHNTGPGTFVFEGLRAVEKKTGMGLAAEKASVVLKVKGVNPGLGASFDLGDVNFLSASNGKALSFGNLDALVAAPFNSQWRYSRIAGTIYAVRDGMRIEGLEAKSDELRLDFTGTLGNQGAVAADIVIHFADALTDKIPPELTGIVLQNDGGGWKSLSVRLDGNYTAPSIQISSKLFRLNIGVKEEDPL